MLRISRIADYGVVLCTRLVGSSEGGPRSARDLSVDTGIPEPTVSKVLKHLGRASLVASERGAHGGYRLARSAERISVAEVVSAIEGPIGITACGIAEEEHDCELTDSCQVRGNWLLINRAILGALESISLADMARSAPTERLVSLGRGHSS